MIPRTNPHFEANMSKVYPTERKSILLPSNNQRKANVPRITVTSGSQESVLRSLQKVEECLQSFPTSNAVFEDLEEQQNKQFWMGIKNDLIEIAELTCLTTQFEHCCMMDEECPFHDHSDNTAPAHVLPSLKNIRKEVRYGGFESLMKNDSDFEVEDQEDENQSVQFRRHRGTPVRRKKNITSLNTSSSGLLDVFPLSEVTTFRERSLTLPSIIIK